MAATSAAPKTWVVAVEGCWGGIEAAPNTCVVVAGGAFPSPGGAPKTWVVLADGGGRGAGAPKTWVVLAEGGGSGAEGAPNTWVVLGMGAFAGAAGAPNTCVVLREGAGAPGAANNWVLLPGGRCVPAVDEPEAEVLLDALSPAALSAPEGGGGTPKICVVWVLRDPGFEPPGLGLPKIPVFVPTEEREGFGLEPGMRTSPEGVAVKTQRQRVHWTDAPAGGSSRGSRSYCIEH